MRKTIDATIILLILFLIITLLVNFIPITPFTDIIYESQLSGLIFTIFHQALFAVPLTVFFFITYKILSKDENINIFSSSRVNDKVDTSKAAAVDYPIGGVLYFLGILLGLGIVGLFFSTMVSFNEVRNYPFSGFEKTIKLYGLLFDVLIFGFSVYLFINFVNKTKKTPMIFVFFFCTQVIGFLVFVLICDTGSNTRGLMQVNYYYLIRSVVTANIWIPYLLTSERVKRTFVL